MSEEVGALHYTLTIEDGKVQGQLAENTKKVKDFGEQASSVGDKVSSGMKKAAVGFAAVGAGLTLVAKNATDFTVETVKSATALGKQIGVSTVEASRLTAAFGRMGIEGDKVQQMFGIFSKNIVASTKNSEENRLATEKLKIQIEQTKKQIAQTTEEIKKNGDSSGVLGLKVQELNNKLASQKEQLNQNADGFAKLGVKTKDAAGNQKDFNTLLFEVADKFKGMKDGADKTALAMELFGRQGKDMLRVLNLGSGGIKELEKQADRLGLTLNAKTISAVNAYVQSQKDLKQSTDAMKLSIGTATAPVLTDFNMKMNQMVQSVLNSEGPMRSAAVNVLAFGGPVASGAAALTGFAANLSTVNGAALMAGARFGAIGIAAAAATVGVGYLGASTYKLAQDTNSASSAFFSWQGGVLSRLPVFGMAATAALSLAGAHNSNTHHTNQARDAHDRLSNSINIAKGATDNLANANTAKLGADLAVEQAQRTYNETVARYGPSSLEARTAAYHLQRAHDEQKAAVDRAKEAVNKKKAADSDVGRNRDLVNGLNNGKRAADDQKSAIDQLIGKIKNFNATSVAKKIFSIAIDVNTALLRKLRVPGFASGVQNFGGGMALVGEKGPELAYLPKGSNVIPAGPTSDMMNGRGGGDVTNAPTNNVYVNIGEINNDQDEAYVLRRIDRDQLLVNRGGSPA